MPTHDQMKEMMACQVCSKPEGLPLDECHVSIGKKNPLCNEYGKCRIAEKSEPQLGYAFSGIDKNIFLKACPGSGKTEIVGLKTAYEIQKWDKEVGGIAVLTFTNNAADVISERVSQFAGIEKIKYPHFIGTFDSWLHGYIGHPFGHILTKYKGRAGDFSIRVLGSNDNPKFIENNNFKTQPYSGKGVVKAHEYYRDREGCRYIYCNPRKGCLDFAGESELKRVKDNFIESGFANYQDMENICITLLSKEKTIAGKVALRFPLIIVDECQDLSWIQLQILKKLKDSGSKLHFAGDLNQGIYDFKKADPAKVKGFIVAEKFEERLLSDNFRSCQPIVNICRKIVSDEIDIAGMCKQKITSPSVCLIYEDKNDLCKLPARFQEIIHENEFDVNKSIVVARGWATIGAMRPSGNDRKVNHYFKRLAMAIHLWKSGDIQAMGDSIAYLARFFSEKYFDNYLVNSRKYYCPECVDSTIQWRVFLKKVLDKCVQNHNLIDFTKTGTEWAKYVRSDFGEIARNCKQLLVEVLTENVNFSNFDGNSFRASDASNPVEDLFSGHVTAKSDIQINTIHSVKGQTFDAIMIVSAPTKKGSNDNHWEYWLADPTSEAARLAYVASSRPKHLLVWAVPKGNNESITQLIELGFMPVEL
ncbi:MAG: ATP-dependent helicase [Phycisphaerae bacterium]|nr:ATP-dependent helicase [Phycisphaerae bacterium]